MPSTKGTPLDPAIYRVRLDRLKIFEISERELDDLERGSPESLSLNFRLFTLGVFLSFMSTLLSTTIQSPWVFATFVLIAVSSALAMVGFFIRFRQSRGSLQSIAAQIRARDLSAGVQERP